MSNSEFWPVTEPWSAGYEMVQNAEVHAWPQEEAVMDFDMFDKLQGQFGRPLVGYVDGLHYHFKPERQIPQGAAAIPEDNHVDPEVLLIQR